MNILFVCTGNTCRSPMAAALAAKVLEKRGEKGFTIFSAGLQADEGAEATEEARAALRRRGIKMQQHTARQLTADMVNKADHIVTMTEDQARLVRMAYPFGAHKVTTYLPGQDIPDPFGGGEADYDRAFSALEGGLPEVFSWKAGEEGDE